jgi:hypothetical protein
MHRLWLVSPSQNHKISAFIRICIDNITHTLRKLQTKLKVKEAMSMVARYYDDSDDGDSDDDSGDDSDVYLAMSLIAQTQTQTHHQTHHHQTRMEVVWRSDRLLLLQAMLAMQTTSKSRPAC